VTRRWRTVLVIGLALWALTPVAMLVLRASTPAWRYPQIVPESLDLEVVGAPEARRLGGALATSLLLAALAAPASTVLGFSIARAIQAGGRTLRAFVGAVALFPVIAPPIALGVGLQVVVLQAGLGGTFGGVLLAHLVPATGYVTLFAVGVFTAFDMSIEDEARTLGASRWQVLRHVTMPLLAPRLVEGMLLGALVSWGQLAISLVVGGGLVRTLPLELLSLVRSGNDQHGALAAIVLTIPPALGLGLLQSAVRRTGTAT
jgi:putative spermidine/putrescine transport system permease protein